MSSSLRLIVLAVLIALAGAACKETGDVQVSSITFSGAKAVKGEELKAIIATRENGFLPWSRKHFFDREEFDLDVRRIEAYYADRGYPNAKVVGVDAKLNEKKDKVDITVEIAEGEPVMVENVSFEGLDAIPADHLERLPGQLPIKAGNTRDQKLILASHDVVVAELRDHGFPYGNVRVVERPGSLPTRVNLVIVGDTGPKAAFGAISIEGVASVEEDVIRRELAFDEGDLYQLSRITESQRRLYSLELFQFVNITPRLPEDRSPQVPVVVTVAEGKHRRLLLGAGYGSEEKARARVNWRHVNFGGGARTGETEAKWSSLEQGVRGSFTEPFLVQPGLSVRLTGSTWWSKEPTYESRSSGGRLMLSKDFSRTGVGTERGARNRLNLTLIREYEDYAISDSALADQSFREELIALGLDPDTGRGSGTLSAFAVDFERNTSLQPLNPRQGYSVSARVENAGSLLGGSFNYNELHGEVRTYLGLGERFIWASRARSGTLAGSDGAQIPFYKRYFVGGSSSVRGWGRYQVSPLNLAGFPIGGRTMMEVSTEARFGIRGKLSGVAFVDGGNVWRDPWDVQLSDLRWAAGPGLRYDTPIGPMRIDVGFQLNPIEGLVIEGIQEKRKWRVHFSIGQAF
ncbi:MAG TPA: BamA/TamA family outer membrane protein [Vicinamibacterales bacterium]|nr:BamA/TamA family outer membrane protein [Vicinamibacterales bacterium]